jgi:hypothetical protein
LAHAFLWEYSYERLKLVQLLGQLGIFLTKDFADIGQIVCIIFPAAASAISLPAGGINVSVIVVDFHHWCKATASSNQKLCA